MKLQRFDEIVSKYMTESDMFLDKFKEKVSIGDYKEALDEAIKIAKQIDPEMYYWKEFETWIAEEGGSRILMEWYDKIFKLTDGKFLDDTRKSLLFDNYGIDTLKMIKERYSLDNWDYRAEYLKFHE